jgi:hypothetical protein
MWMITFFKRRVLSMADKKKRDKIKSTLSRAQEVTYARDFKLADQAGGYTAKKARH